MTTPAHLMTQFGVQEITPDLLARFRELTGGEPFSPLLERGLFFAHRDLPRLITQLEKKEPIYLYTGRGPSSPSMHLGHLIPFRLTAELQRRLKAKVVIQLTDDEKFFSRKLTEAQVAEYTEANRRDILACGFDPEDTLIFRNSETMGLLYPNVCRLQRVLTLNQIMHTFGLEGSSNMGQVSFPVTQMAPAFPSTFPEFLDPKALCLIIAAVDQDPYFRPLRDVASRLKEKKPVILYSSYLPSLQGTTGKMSSSDPRGSVFLDDTPKQIRKKIGASVSGGGETVEDQRREGADLEVDVAYQYLRFFHPDLSLVEEVGKNYASGKMLTGEVKKLVIDLLAQLTQEHQEARRKLNF